MNEYFLENTIARFFNLIEYVALFSVPVIIVWLVMNARKKQLQMKYDIIMKSLDNGVQVDPKELLAPAKSPISAAVNKLKKGIIEGGIGLFLASFGMLIVSKVNWAKIKTMTDDQAEITAIGLLLIIVIVIIGVVLLFIGISNIASYFAYKKQLKINGDNGSGNHA